LAVSLGLIVGLFLFFERTLYGKALRATAVNRMGARLMGISPTLAGKATFLVATFIGALSGILIAPITTLYFDSGFIISLKGFVGAIIGGLVSYPIAAIGAVAVGLIEAFSMFWASNYKEIIVFTLIIPFLLWRSFTSRHVEESSLSVVGAGGRARHRAAAATALLRDAAQLHWPLHSGGAGPGVADRRRRHDQFRAGGLRRAGCLYLCVPDHY
jgi:hypothetical protein